MSIINRAFLFISLMTAFFSARSQHQEISEKPLIYKSVKDSAIAARSLLEAFKSGRVNGHFRYFYMATNNESPLTDYYANALGGGLRFESGSFHRFRFAVSGFYTFNMGASDLSLKDSFTGQFSRYETSLFDIENPNQKKDLDRLEEFYLRYDLPKGKLVFGRQFINTAFINLQDGRMRPTSVKAIWWDGILFSNIKMEGGWIYEVSPRGTMRWYNAGESVGLYSTGVNEDGSKSEYAGNLKSKGIAVIGLSRSVGKNIRLQAWNYYTENIFNTSMLQADATLFSSGKRKWLAGLQWVRQDAIKEGGNADPSKSYMRKDHSSMVISARFGSKSSRSEADINYTRITKAGRFLMPREWGRDPFYTFLPRERNEGLGDVHAFTMRYGYIFWNEAAKAVVQAGYYDLPDVANYALNKYGMPSYWQMNIDLRYRFRKSLEGFELQWLTVGKKAAEKEAPALKYIFNKVNLMHHNLVINFYF
jgi:hypothetical protein